MVFKFISNIKNRKVCRGITLIEIIVVIFIVGIFSLILITNFPEILRQIALSKVTYKLSQDLRRTEDLGLSGVVTKDALGTAISAKGYGVYIEFRNSPIKSTKYIIYADVPDDSGNSDQKYSGGLLYPLCERVMQDLPGSLKSDCVLEVIDVSRENSSLSILGVVNNSSDEAIEDGISINFSPPNPDIKIKTDSPTAPIPGIKIYLSNGHAERTVSVNTSGLIEVK